MKERPEVRLSLSEHERLEQLQEVQKGRKTQRAAAAVLGLSERWTRELQRRVRAHGEAGLIHRNRGRRSNRRLADPRRDEILSLYREKYEEFNLTHFREMLQDREKVEAPCRETLRRVLLEAGLWTRRRRAPKHRLRRPRREREGELLQMDASIHRWFGEDLPLVALLGAVDDATGDVPFAKFCDAETSEGYFDVVAGILRTRGVPQAFYTDRDSVFLVNDPKERERQGAQGKPPLTQVGRAFQELGIQRITAYSPQAKGRIERLWKTFQDRLLHELRLNGITTIAAANTYLHRSFLPRYNRRFRRPPADPEAAYRPSPPQGRVEAILCFKHSRVLSRDHVFPFEGQTWQVLRCKEILALTGKTIEVRKTTRGAVQAWHGAHRLTLRLLPPPPLASLRRAVGARAPLAAAAGTVRGKVWM